MASQPPLLSTRKPSNAVFIGNLPFDVSEQMLHDIFAQIGPIKSMRLVTDKDTGKPKGFAFAEYHDQFAAESAVRNLNAHDLSGRQIRVDFAEEGPATREAKERERSRGERDMRQPPPLVGPPGTKPVGAAAAAAAANSMASMLGGPPGPGPIQDATNSVVGGLSPMQLYSIMGQMRSMIQQDPQRARHTLISNPQLTKALFQAQILLGMVKPPPGVGAPPQPPQPQVAPTIPQPLPPQQPQQPVASLPIGSAPPAILASMPPPAPVIAPQIVPAPAFTPPAPAFGGAVPPPQTAVSGAGPSYSIGPGGVLQLVQPPMMTVDPTQQGIQYLPSQQQAPAMPQPQPQVPVAQPSPAPAAQPAPAISGDQAAVLQQVMAMTPEQIDALPEVTRSQVLQVKQLLMAQGAK